MSEGAVHCDIQGDVARITFDCLETHNAMTWKMYDDLARASEKIAATPAVKVAVLRGRGGRAFVAGTDISQFTAFDTAEDGLGYERRIESCLSGLESLAVPTLAVIDGWAVGGGLAIASCCDIRIATPTARFSVPIARTVGNCLSAANYARLAVGLGWDRAVRLLLLGDYLDAVDAQTAGFVSEIVDGEQISARADAIAERLARNAPITMAVTKGIKRRMLQAMRIDDEDFIRKCYGSADFRHGVRAFVDRKDPVWTGR